MKELIARVRRPAGLAAWALALVAVSWAATAWADERWLTLVVAAWWRVVFGAVLVAGFAAPFLFLGDAREWNNPGKWPTLRIGLHVVGLGASLGIVSSLLYAVAVAQCWISW